MAFNLTVGKEKFIKNCYEKSMKELNKFFRINWKKDTPKIVLMADRKAIDKHRGAKTEDWVVGYVKNNKVFVLSPENYEKESCHKFSEKEYYGLIKHELVHLFEFAITKSNNSPNWLREGLAFYLAGQLENKKKPKHLNSFLRYYKKFGEGIYTESGFAVKFLIENYGKNRLFKLFRLIKTIKSEKQFYKKFKDVYGFELSYKNINNS